MAPILRSKVVDVATSVFRSKRSPRESMGFTGPSAANAHKEKKGFSRLAGAGLGDMGSSRQGSGGDEEKGIVSQTQGRESEQKEEANLVVDEVRR